MVYRAIMAPFLGRAVPAAPGRSAAKTRVHSEKLQRPVNYPVSHSRRPERVGAARLQRATAADRYFIAASYILATYSQLTR